MPTILGNCILKPMSAAPRAPAAPTYPGNRTPRKGRGYLAGELPTSVLGVPTQVLVRALYRPANGVLGDGSVVASTLSSVAGIWQILDLDPALKFDIVARYPGYNDVIVSNLSPVPYDVVSLAGSFSASGNLIAGTILVSGGFPGAYSVSLESGTAPPGVTFSVTGHALTAAGEAPAGTHNFTLRVTASNGAYALKSFSLTVA